MYQVQVSAGNGKWEMGIGSRSVVDGEGGGGDQ